MDSGAAGHTLLVFVYEYKHAHVAQYNFSWHCITFSADQLPHELTHPFSFNLHATIYSLLLKRSNSTTVRHRWHFNIGLQGNSIMESRQGTKWFIYFGPTTISKGHFHQRTFHLFPHWLQKTNVVIGSSALRVCTWKRETCMHHF